MFTSQWSAQKEVWSHDPTFLDIPSIKQSGGSSPETRTKLISTQRKYFGSPKLYPSSPLKEETEKSPYLEIKISCQRPEASEIIHYLHLSKRAQLNRQISLTPKPPLFLGLQEFAQLAWDILESLSHLLGGTFFGFVKYLSIAKYVISEKT